MQTNSVRRIASSRRMAQFFMHPSSPAVRDVPRAPRRGESPVAALYENRFRCMDEVTLPGADCQARHEPLQRYLDARDHVSASMLRRFARGETAVQGRQLRSGSLGEALHALLLEPRRFEREYWVPGRGEAIDEEAVANRTWLTAHDYDRLRGMRDAVLSHRRLPLAEWLEYGAREWSVYWSDVDGGRWKARPDCFNDEVVLEVKTTTDVRPQAFARARRRFRHDLQAAHYVEGIERLCGRAPRFLFVSVESVAPHYVWVHELEGAALKAARAELSAVRTAFVAAQAGGSPRPATASAR
jgi:hypothetical protein